MAVIRARHLGSPAPEGVADRERGEVRVPAGDDDVLTGGLGRRRMGECQAGGGDERREGAGAATAVTRQRFKERQHDVLLV
jgi:hypothetical protein